MLRFRICGSTFAVLEGDGGQVLLQTPSLDGTLSCRAMIVNIRLTALLDERYERTEVAHGYAFTLRGPNGLPIAVSPVFATHEECERAIASVRRHASSAPVEYSPRGVADFDRRSVLAAEDVAVLRDRESTAPTTSHEEHFVVSNGDGNLQDA